jgi:hypothetical protein
METSFTTCFSTVLGTPRSKWCHRARALHGLIVGCPSLGDSSWCSITTLLRTAAALVDVCVVPRRLARCMSKYLRTTPGGTTLRSIDLSPTVLVLPERRPLVLCCRANAFSLDGDSAAELLVGSGSGSIEDHTKGSRDADWGVGIWETSGERWGTAWGRTCVSRWARARASAIPGWPRTLAHRRIRGRPQRLTSEPWKGRTGQLRCREKYTLRSYAE